MDNILGIIRYDSTSTDDPSSTAYTYTDSCDDEDATDLVPYLTYDVGTDYSVSDSFTGQLDFTEQYTKWKMGASTFISDWDYPSVLHVADGNTTWSSEENAILLPTAGEWVMFVVETTFAQAHPIHLHGHDFWILATGTGTYDSSTVTLQTSNNPRRDVVMLPASGYVVIAFRTENPGVSVALPKSPVRNAVCKGGYPSHRRLRVADNGMRTIFRAYIN